MTFKHYPSRWNVELGINSHIVHACICVDVCQCVCMVLVVDGGTCMCAHVLRNLCVYIAYVYIHVYMYTYIYMCVFMNVMNVCICQPL